MAPPPPRKPANNEVLDALQDMLNFVRSMIQSQPCSCQVTQQGLQRCRRCLLLTRIV